MNGEMNHNGRSLADILSESKEELKQFLATRVALFRAESREKLALLKLATMVAAVAGLLLGTAYLLFTLALVGLIAAFMSGNPFRWCVAFLAVSVLWAITGTIAALIARRAFASRKLIPVQTLSVLKEDGIWIQSEVGPRI